MRLGELFAGVGGLGLGLGWGLGGAETVWQVEYEEHARLILAQHWPEAERHQDVRHVGGYNLAPVSLICGGWPCQPHSVAGKRESSNDDRDLWGEFARVIGELRPRWVVGENVPGVLSSADPAFSRDHPGGFFGRVLRDLACLGFDAEWARFPAAAVGAHHRRERVFLVAYPRRSGWGQAEPQLCRGERYPAGQSATLAHANSERQPQPQGGQPHERGWAGDSGREIAAPVAHAHRAGRQEQHAPALSERAGYGAGRGDALGIPSWAGGDWEQPHPLTRNAGPGVCRVADGPALRLDRLIRLGNGVVPQQAAVVGRAIREAEAHWERHGVMPERIIRPEHVRWVREELPRVLGLWREEVKA